MNKEFSHTFETSGIYYYVCTPHKSMGMIGLVGVGGDLSNKDLIAEALGHEYGNAVTGIYLEPFDLDKVDEMNERARLLCLSLEDLSTRQCPCC